MISSAHRFHGRSSLRFVYQHGKTVRGALISLRYAFNSRQPIYRAAVVVSRKVSKSAVVRNRLRRRVYEIVRKNSARITGPYDLVFSVYDQQVAGMSHASLQKTILTQLKQAGAVSNVPTSGANHGDHGIVKKKETNK